MAIHSLVLLHQGFHDALTDAALVRLASSQAARDAVVLSDLQRDLQELEQQYQMPSEDFFRCWKTGELSDSADFTDWSALYQMMREIQPFGQRRNHNGRPANEHSGHRRRNFQADAGNG